MKLSLKLMIAVTLCALDLSVGWAQRQYPGSPGLPEDVVWMREIYRTLDLTKDTNGALYYPVEPQGNKMNLFATVFRLLAQKKIPAYEYRLDGNEVLTTDNRINFKDLLDRFHIFYEEKVENRRDTMLVIDNSDIPSSEVLSYFVKEDWYFDQRSSTYNTKVVAICPVLHRSGDFTPEVTTYPMFWLNYKDISPYLGRTPIMTSNLNNTANITMDDYFTTRQFSGDIYKTTNMLNQTLAQYCPTDSALVNEQKRIEGQLEAFGQNLWESTRIKPVEKVDSTALASDAGSKDKSKAVKANSKRKGRDTATSTSSSKTTKVKKESTSKASKSSSSPRVSVRRQRR